MATINDWSNQIAGSVNQIILNPGTNGAVISSDASAATISIATGSAAKVLQLGSTNSTSSFVLQAGSAASTITTANATLGVTTGTGDISISDDATNTTCNLFTGAGAKLSTVGSTNTTSSLSLKFGTADYTLSSATGTIVSALDTGEIVMPLQSAYLAYLASADNNVTGNNTNYVVGTNVALTEVFDQNGDYNGVTFTAPKTGRYHLTGQIVVSGLAGGTLMTTRLATSNRTFLYQLGKVTGTQNIARTMFVVTDFDAADIANMQVVVTGNGADTGDLAGSATLNIYSSACLVC